MKTNKKELQQQIEIDSTYLHLYIEFEKYITRRVIATLKVSKQPEEWLALQRGLLRWKKIFTTGKLNEELSDRELDTMLIKVGKKWTDPFE